MIFSLQFCVVNYASQEAHSHHLMHMHAERDSFLQHAATTQSINTTIMPKAFFDYYETFHVSAFIATGLHAGASFYLRKARCQDGENVPLM